MQLYAVRLDGHGRTATDAIGRPIEPWIVRVTRRDSIESFFKCNRRVGRLVDVDGAPDPHSGFLKNLVAVVGLPIAEAIVDADAPVIAKVLSQA